jgi:hypothetical protein
MTCGTCAVPVKKWYHSKILWVNFLALLATIIQAWTGFVVSPEYQGLALTVINMILRAITNEKIEWK